MMRPKSASKALLRVRALQLEPPIQTAVPADTPQSQGQTDYSSVKNDAETSSIDYDDKITEAPQAKMLKKSASKSIMKLEPIRSVDAVRSPISSSRKSTVDITNSAVTSLTEVSDNVLNDLDDLVKHLGSSETSSVTQKIIQICKELKTYGHILERKDSMQMDRYFVALRDAAQNKRIELSNRLRLLEIIELRASGWKGGDGLDQFYKNKLIELENSENAVATSNSFSNGSNSINVNTNNGIQLSSSPTSTSPILSFSNSSANPLTANNIALAPGEVLKSSGKFGKPAKIPSKNYFKDEIVIHNADSGKVMGIKGRRVHMIEELSGTIVSFQRVLPGAKDRLVQITGPTENAVGYAQQLIEETIVRNTSPIRDRANPLQTSESSSNIRKLTSSLDSRPSILHSMSMNDATLGEYQYTVNVGQDLIKLAGSKLDVIRTAKLVLEEYFAGDAKRTSHEPLDELLTLSDDESAGSTSPTNEDRPPLTRSVSFGGMTSSVTGASSATLWPERNGHRLTKAARITGRCISHESTTSAIAANDSDDEEEDEDDEEEEEELFEKDYKSPFRAIVKDLNFPIVYSREALLNYSRSPYSTATPKCLAKIIQDNPTILKKTPEFFNPTTHCLSSSPIEFAHGRKNSRESQEREE